MADDDRRVAPLPMVVAGGMTATAEGIAELERRRIKVERQRRPKPTKDFGAILKRKATEDEEEPSEKEKRFAELPKKGPRPGLVHPSQRDAYGRDEESDEPVILKG